MECYSSNDPALKEIIDSQVYYSLVYALQLIYYATNWYLLFTTINCSIHILILLILHPRQTSCAACLVINNRNKAFWLYSNVFSLLWYYLLMCR